jgi:hypothetical protein
MIARRELGALALGSALLAVLMSWPLVLHMGSDIPQDLGDPVRTAWQVAWEGHALGSSPLHIFDSNAFFPLGNSLAFSDSLLGYAPAGLVGDGVTATLARYDVLYLFAYALAFAGGYLLARELGVRPLAAAVAGAAFAYAPFRLTMNGHLHVISSGGIALALFLLVRGYRRRSPWYVVAGWLVAAWQLTLGFTLGLQLAYLLGVLAVVAAVVWVRRGRPALTGPVLAATAAGAVAFAGVAAVQARPYLKVSHDYPTAQRNNGDLARYSPPPEGLLAAPEESRVWGDATAPIRNGLPSRNEDTLFPGLVIVALAIAGALAGPFPLSLRIGLAVAAVAITVLAFGTAVADGWLGYRLLFEIAPGWEGVRAPGRLVTLTSLALGLLAAGGAQAALDRLGRWRAVAVPVAGVVLVGAILLEGSGGLPHPSVPNAPAGQRAAAAPQIHLPTDTSYDRLYQYWSTAGFPKIWNGNSTFEIPSRNRLRARMAGFPDRTSVSALRRLGIRSVILHTDLARVGLPPTLGGVLPRDPRRAARKPVAGLGITRQPAASGVVLYDLGRGR